MPKTTYDQRMKKRWENKRKDGEIQVKKTMADFEKQRKQMSKLFDRYLSHYC